MNELGYKILPHLPCSPELLPTNYHFFKHLNTFTTSRRQKMLSNSLLNRLVDFYTIGINKHFSLAKMLIAMALFWLMKMCLSLVIMIKTQGPKLQLHLDQPNTFKLSYKVYYCVSLNNVLRSCISHSVMNGKRNYEHSIQSLLAITWIYH